MGGDNIKIIAGTALGYFLLKRNKRSNDTNSNKTVKGRNNEPITEEEVLEMQEKWGKAIIEISQSYLEFKKKEDLSINSIIEKVLNDESLESYRIEIAKKTLKINSTYENLPKDDQDKVYNSINENITNREFVRLARDAVAELYGYDDGWKVLFKPSDRINDKKIFRPTKSGALSYFVGGEYLKKKDRIVQDEGFVINRDNGWSKVEFKNHQIDFHCDGKIAIAMGSYVFTDTSKSNQKNLYHYTFGYKRNKNGKVRIFLHHDSIPEF